MEFAGKVALVVGASSGIGRLVSRALAAEGAKVSVTARRQLLLETLADEIHSAGGDCLPLAADATDDEAASTVVARTIERYGRIDLVLLNAGGAPALDLTTMTAGEIKYYMRMNYDVAVNYLVPVLAQMKRQRSGLVAHTNSLAGLIGVPLQGPYSAGKGALKLLTDTMRIEYRTFGIRFVSIYPGFIGTEATKGDGMPAPLEMSPEQGAAHILYALRNETVSYVFPPSLRWAIRLGSLLPTGLQDRLLAKMVCPA